MNILELLFCKACVWLLVLVMPLTLAYAAEPVKIGVLAFRPKPQTLAQWQPLAAALKQAMPERDFVIEALTYPELDSAVASRSLDFVLTNPGHYVLLTKRSGLSAPLATLAGYEQGKVVTVFGGVIFSLAKQANIEGLADLRGKTIAAVSTDSIGGYQMQAYELKHLDIQLPHDARLLVTGVPQDKVVDAVLSGRAHAGFVRTGTLEAIAREGKLDIARLRILNRQNLPDFPVQASTRLYPEWPFAALPHIDESLARHVAAALFRLEENPAATRAMGIHGFVIPADYTPVSDMLRELRMPPFEATPEFTLQDVWRQYRWWAVATLMAGALILLLVLRLLLSNRRLDAGRRIVQQSEERYRLLVESSPFCIHEIDLQGRLLSMNKAGLDMLGLDDFRKIRGMPYLGAVSKQDAEHVGALLQDAIDYGTSSHFEFSAADDAPLYFKSCFIPIKDANGKVLKLMGITEDTTKRREFDEELKRSNVELEQFSYAVSHDMRQPLRMISSYLQLLDRSLGDQLDSEKRDYFNFAIEGAKRIDQMLVALLEYSRMGRMGEPPSWTDSRTLLDAALQFLQPAIVEAQARLYIMGDWPQILASHDEIQRLIQNLIGNAIKYRVAGRTPEITVCSETVKNEWHMYVTDNGVGIIPGQIKRLFQVFQRLQSREAYEGTGIGLALCRKIAEHHKGRIWAESAGVDQGSRFCVALPVMRAGAISARDETI